MQSTIDRFYRKRKIFALDEVCDIPSSKRTARKLFLEQDSITYKSQSKQNTDVELSTPTASPVSQTNIQEDEDNITYESQSNQNTDTELSTPTRSPASQTKLRKELELGEYRGIIRQSKRFTILKHHIEKFNESLATLKETEKSFGEIRNCHKLNTRCPVELEITSPVKRGQLKPKRLFGPESTQSPSKESSYVSPSKLLAEGPVKSPVKPSFERFHHLIADGKDPLVLPRKYLLLKDIFHWLETIIKIRNDRGEIVTFKKIQPEVQRIIRRNFTEQHLGKIKAVYPESYELSRQRMKLPMFRNETYELVIYIPEGNRDSVKRQNTFYNLLLEKSKLYHEIFLKSLDPPLDIPVHKMKRWHPEFNVDEVPDIEPVAIPQPPVNKDILVSAKDVLEKTRQIISNNKRMERAVSLIIDEKNEQIAKTTFPEKTSPIIQPIADPIPAFQKALNGVPKAILDKIRAKQAAKAVQGIIQTSAEVKESAMLSRLPELAKILRIVFVSEKKGILPEEFVIEKVSKSYKEKMPKRDLIEHLQMISKHLPGWMNFCIVRNSSYIRLSKDADMTRVIGKLQKLINST